MGKSFSEQDFFMDFIKTIFSFPSKKSTKEPPKTKLHQKKEIYKRENKKAQSSQMISIYNNSKRN